MTTIIRVALILFLTNKAWGHVIEIIAPAYDAETGLRGGFYVAMSRGQTSFTTNLDIGPHSFWGGVMHRNTPTRQNDWLRLGYSFNWQLTDYFTNESSLGLGYLSSRRLHRCTYLSFWQAPIGVQDYLRLKLGENTRLGLGAAAVKDLTDKEAGWDNAKYEAYLQHALVSTSVEKWLFDLRTSSKIYNQDRYFFVQKRNLVSFRTGPQYSGKLGQFTFFGGTEIEKFDSDPHKKIIVFGTNVDLNISSGNILRLRAGISGDTINQVDSQVLSLSWEKPEHTLEIYSMVRKGESWQREKTIGGKITFQLLGDTRKNQPMFSPEEYREPVKRSDFYVERGFKDDQKLTPKEQAKRLNTIHLRNEWSGMNLVYRSFGGPARRPLDVYNTRRGDCDDQALLNAWLDRQNNYRAYLLSYWPTYEKYGHGVEIVQDPKTGRWFLDEYGTLQEILVAPDAPIETVALEALKQVTEFTALPIKNGAQIWYWLDMPVDNPKDAKRITNYIITDNFQSTAGRRPRIEKGYELFVGPDALWR